MEKPVKILKSFAEAKEAEKKYYQSLTPAERLQILMFLRRHYYPNDDGRMKKVFRIVKLSDKSQE